MTRVTSIRRAIVAMLFSAALIAGTAAQVLAGGSNPPFPK